MAYWTIAQSQQIQAAARWDAEAFSPVLRSLDDAFNMSPRLSELASVTHPAEIPRNYDHLMGSKRFILAQNIRPVLPDLTVEFRIASNISATIPNNRLCRSDVLVTRTGANSGMAAVYLGEDGDAYTSGEGLIVRSYGNVSGAYLAVLLSTSIGGALCRRSIYGSGQPHIAPHYLEQLPVPRLGEVEMEVGLLVSSAYAGLKRVEEAYFKAESEVLEQIGWREMRERPVELTYSLNFRKCLNAGRSDAEFFQPRVQALLAHLRQQGRTIQDVAELREELFIPERGG